MEPEGANLAADGDDVAGGDGAHDEQAHEDGDPYTGTADAEGVNHVHIGQSSDEHQDDGENEHGGVKTNDEHDVVPGHLVGWVTQEEQVLDLLGVLLQQQVDAEHEHEERQQTDEDAHSDDDTADDS